MKPIAVIRTDFPSKFGVPRQSGLVPNMARIVFEKEYRIAEAFRGLEQYSHLWLIWEFSLQKGEGAFSPTVRPPRLGGNQRVGVFATRSPNRPNPIGLSVVKLEEICHTDQGVELLVSGADMVDGTPIYDIKPYLPYVDCHPEASGGFAEEKKTYALQVSCEVSLLESYPPEQQAVLLEVLRQDPRPSYQNDPERVYGFSFAGHEVRFTVDGDRLTVVAIQ